MVSRNRRNLPIPDSLSTNDCRTNLTSLTADILSGNPVRIKRGKKNILAEYYRGNKIENGEVVQDVVVALKSIYGNKCVFCESQRTVPDVEHFRPKKGIVGIPKAVHQGYFWLCYEWTNLLPSCSDCNDVKGNYFPIANEPGRVYGPSMTKGLPDWEEDVLFDRSPLSLEVPLLLHPGFDVNCDEYFAFTATGGIVGIDAAGRGSLNRIRLGLDRPDLIYFRQKEINNFVEKFEMALCFPEDTLFIDVLNKLRSRGIDLDGEYSALCKYLYNHFDELIVPLLPNPGQDRAETIYLNNRNPIPRHVP